MKLFLLHVEYNKAVLPLNQERFQFIVEAYSAQEALNKLRYCNDNFVEYQSANVLEPWDEIVPIWEAPIIFK